MNKLPDLDQIAQVAMPAAAEAAIRQFGKPDDPLGESIWQLLHIRAQAARRMTEYLIEPLTDLASYQVDVQVVPAALQFALRHCFTPDGETWRLSITRRNVDQFYHMNFDHCAAIKPCLYMRITYRPQFIVLNGQRIHLHYGRQELAVAGLQLDSPDPLLRGRGASYKVKHAGYGFGSAGLSFSSAQMAQALDAIREHVESGALQEVIE